MSSPKGVTRHGLWWQGDSVRDILTVYVGETFIPVQARQISGEGILQLLGRSGSAQVSSVGNSFVNKFCKRIHLPWIEDWLAIRSVCSFYNSSPPKFYTTLRYASIRSYLQTRCLYCVRCLQVFVIAVYLLHSYFYICRLFNFTC